MVGLLLFLVYYKKYLCWSPSHSLDISLDRLVILIFTFSIIFNHQIWQNAIDFWSNLQSYLVMPSTIPFIQWNYRFVVLPFVLLFLIGDGLSCKSDRSESSPLLPGSYRDMIYTRCQVKMGNLTQRFKICQAIHNRLFLRPLWTMVFYLT